MTREDKLSRWLKEGRKLYIWGAGNSAIEFLDAYPEITFDGCIESVPKAERFRGLEVYTPVDVEPNGSGIVVASEFMEEISASAKTSGFQEEQLVSYEAVMLADADCCVASYQKSGRTWLRTMLGRVFQQHFRLPECEILKVTQSSHGYIDKVPQMPRLFFYHDRAAHRKTAEQLKNTASIVLPDKVILLTRDPRDIIVSNYYHMTHRAKRNQLDLEAFVRRYFGGIIQYYNDWADEIAQGDVCVIKYEALKTETKQSVIKALAYLDFAPDSREKLVEEAVAYASLDNMKQYEAENRFNSKILSNDGGGSDAAKVRSGQVRGFRNELSEELQRWCEEQLESLSPIIGYEREA